MPIMKKRGMIRLALILCFFKDWLMQHAQKDGVGLWGVCHGDDDKNNLATGRPTIRNIFGVRKADPDSE